MKQHSILFNPATADFFKHKDRSGFVSDFEQVCREIFDVVYNRDYENHRDKIKKYYTMSDHPFFLMLLEHYNTPYPIDCEKARCNLVFAEYLCQISKISNRNTFKSFMRFVVLFRECLNYLYRRRQLNSDSTEDSKPSIVNGIYKEEYGEYSDISTAEDAPDIANDFVTEFLETDNNFFDFTSDEVINITQNFCSWMYDNNFTCSKLSLLSMQ